MNIVSASPYDLPIGDQLPITIKIVLVKPRFPENIGMVARACANMGFNDLRLVLPQRWNLHKAKKLATPKGIAVLHNMEIFSSLNEAISDCNAAFATTARTGGWRKTILTPEYAAHLISLRVALGEKIALIFGPEDCGLENSEILSCMGLIHIPTQDSASSLNLAQAVLLTLYECSKAVKASIKKQPEKAAKKGTETSISLGQLALLETNFKRILDRLDCRQGKNPEYHFMQWHNIFARVGLRRHEFDALMGFCRQLENRLNKLQ